MPIKVTALSAGTPTTDDLLYFVDDPSGTPASKKITVGSAANVFAGLSQPVVFAHLQAGADACAQISAAIALVPSAGGIIDARGLVGAQSFGADLTIGKSVKILFGVGTYALGSSRIIVTAGIDNVALVGALGGSGGSSLADESGTVFTYTGTGDCFSIGDSTADTYHPTIEHIKVDCSGAGSAARGIVFNRIVHGRIKNPQLRMAAGTQEGICLDGQGSGGWCVYNTIEDFQINGGNYGIRLTSDSPSECNANRIMGGAIIAATTGLCLEKGGQNVVIGTDLDTCTTGLSMGADAKRNYVVARFEGNTTDILWDANAVYNWIQYIGDDSIVVSGTNPINNYNNLFDAAAGINFDHLGNLTAPTYRFALGTRITESSDGVLLLRNSINTMGRLQFGGTTSGYPALAKNNQALEVWLADLSAMAECNSLYQRTGSGSPEAAVTAPIGAVFHRTDGGAGTSLYTKIAGTGNTGWTPAAVVQQADVALTNANIKALRATPITMVAAPGAGKAVVFHRAELLLDAGANALTEAGDNLAFKYENGSGAAVSDTVETTGFIDQTVDTKTTARDKLDAIATKTGSENKALVLHNVGGAEFAGNAANDALIRVKVYYSVITTGW